MRRDTDDGDPLPFEQSACGGSEMCAVINN